MYERMRLTIKRTNSYKNFGSSLAGGTRRLVVARLNGKIKINQEAVIFRLSK